jgi:flagellar biosynthesis GTPase FlhF
MAAQAALLPPMRAVHRDMKALLKSVREGPDAQVDDPQGFFIDARRLFPSSSPHTSIYAIALHHRYAQRPQELSVLQSIADAYECSGSLEANVSLTHWRRALPQSEAALLVDVFQSAAWQSRSVGSPYLSLCFQHEVCLITKGEPSDTNGSDPAEHLALSRLLVQLASDTAAMVEASAAYSQQQSHWHKRQMTCRRGREQREEEAEVMLRGLRQLLRSPSQKRQAEQDKWEVDREERVLAMQKAELDELKEKMTNEKVAIKERTRKALTWEMRLKAQHMERMRNAPDVQRQP